MMRYIYMRAKISVSEAAEALQRKVIDDQYCAICAWSSAFMAENFNRFSA